MRLKECIALAAAIAAIGINQSAYAADYTGTVGMLEVWRNGNVAFTLSVPATTCNGQFILNASDPGSKNQYAALLAAKRTGTQVRVIAGTCGVAENYNSVLYNIVEYLYAFD